MRGRGGVKGPRYGSGVDNEEDTRGGFSSRSQFDEAPRNDQHRDNNFDTRGGGGFQRNENSFGRNGFSGGRGSSGDSSFGNKNSERDTRAGNDTRGFGNEDTRGGFSNERDSRGFGDDFRGQSKTFGANAPSGFDENRGRGFTSQNQFGSNNQGNDFRPPSDRGGGGFSGRGGRGGGSFGNDYGFAPRNEGFGGGRGGSGGFRGARSGGEGEETRGFGGFGGRGRGGNRGFDNDSGSGGGFGSRGGGGFGRDGDSRGFGGRGGGRSFGDFGGGRSFGDGGGGFRGGRGGGAFGSPRGSFGSGANSTPFGDEGSSFGRRRFGGDYDNREHHPSFVPEEQTDEQIIESRIKLEDIHLEEDGVVARKGGPEVDKIIENWTDAGFDDQLVRNIERAGFAKPRNFQKHAIPIIMEGYDLKGKSETGSGKTAAFLLPIIQKLINQFKEEAEDDGRASRTQRVSCLVLVPTRELAHQIYNEARTFTAGTSVKVAPAYGEYNMRINAEAIFRGCDILVACLGRLRHFVEEKKVLLDSLKFFVIDEADRMVSADSLGDLRDLLDPAITKFPKPQDRQSLFFSATFESMHMEFLDSISRRKDTVYLESSMPINKRIHQEVVCVRESDKDQYVQDLLTKEHEETGTVAKTLIFVATKKEADLYAMQLSLEDVKSQTISSDRTQQQRLQCYNEFKNGDIHILVATNVLSRGADFPHLDRVIVKNSSEQSDNDYVHRIGRTGRLRAGTAIVCLDPSLSVDRNIVPQVVEYMKLCGQEPPEWLNHVEEPGYEFPYVEVSSPGLPSFGAPAGTASDGAAPGRVDETEPEF